MKRLCLIMAYAFLTAICSYGQKLVFTPQWTPQSQFAGYYVAEKLGYYKNAGLDVVIEHTTASDVALNRLEKGKSDAITMHLYDAISQIDAGASIVNILQVAQHSAHVIVTRHDDIRTLGDLKGKRVGIWRTSFGHLAQLVDVEHNLDIEWIPFIQSINLYISGAVDATMAMLYNEVYLIRVSGFDEVSYISLADVGYDYPEDGVYVSSSYYAKYPDKAKAFAEASRKGWEWAHDHPEETLDIVLEVMKREGVPHSRLHQEWMLKEVLRQQCETEGARPSFSLSEDKVNEINSLLLKHDRISRPVTVEQLKGEEICR